LVIGSSVLEHLKTDDLASSISDIYEILTPQGYLALGYPVESLPVRLFFRAIGFDFKSSHPSKAYQIRENVEMTFGKPQKIKRLPLTFLPSALAYYETSLFRKGTGSS
jgi:predicted SAM-dependent methyltransferase